MERDKNFQKILLNKEIPEPPDDLEDRIMYSISKAIKQNSANHRYLFLAWFFFIFGLIAGVIISTIWIKSDRFLFGFDLLENGLIIQITCSFVILLLFEKLYKLSIEIKNRYFDIEIK